MAKPLINAALAYANLGLSVFPLTPRNKTPLTEHGFKDATINTALIREWWQKYPTANIGIYCRGLLVLDFDEHTGFQSKCRLEKDYHPLPDTWVVKTGGGTEAKPKEPGRQYIYRVPVETEIAPGAGTYGYPNLDVRAGESHICAVPSITRLPYQTIAGSPETIAQAPQWLIEFVLNGKSNAQRTKAADTKIPYHQRNDYLFRLASSLRAKGLSEATILDSVRSAYENDCDHCDSDGKPVPMDDKELRTITKQGARYKPGIPLPKAPEWEPKENDGVSLVCMAEVEPESVSWLWYPYIPKGKVTLLDGDPGVGKSWSSLAIATAISLGKGLPWAEAVEKGSVVILSAEDGLGDTIRPRLDKMGADVTNIHAVRMRGRSLDFGAGDLTILETLIERVKPSLVIIDPLMAYLGAGVDAHRANETRVVMAKLADIAESHDCSILVIRHLTKGGTLKPIYRGLGSIDFAAAVRSMLLAGCDPDNPEKRGIVHIKCNNANRGKAIGYEIRDDNFYWTRESDLTAARILAAEDSGDIKQARDEAVDFIRDELADGPVDADQVWKDAKAAGLAEATLKRAKAMLSVITRRHGETGKRGGGKFTWELPEGNLEVQKDLGYQEYHIKESDTLNNSSFKNDPLPKTDDTLNTPETALGMSVQKALEIWRSQGAPVIYLGAGENCRNLPKLLSNQCNERQLEAVKAWLAKVKNEV